MIEKKRLDILILEKEIIPDCTRARARAEIMSRNVSVNGKICDKPGTMTPVDSTITVSDAKNPYVSRGGLKLAGAYKDFSLDFKDKIILDAGASTGGFTDFALQHGARKIYAVDVGYGQLQWKLRKNPAVVNMERTNIRYITPEELTDTPQLALADLSFISLKKILPVFATLKIPEIVALIKPQFEAGREKVGKKGVVKDPAVHEEVIAEIKKFASTIGYETTAITPSPIKGPQGNTEFFIHLKKMSQ